jgi:Prokaryotic membrane lipoprotein lipid attachment site
MRRVLFVFVAVFGLTGCPTPPTPLEKASEAAREMNMSARWGVMATAVSKTVPESQAEYQKTHAKWHAETRIFDTELAGVVMTDTTHALVQVDVSWTMSDNTTLRVTRIEQIWVIAEKGGWMMESEKRVGGAIGLLGEDVEIAEPQKDMHFPTKTIR